ncbi:MAG: lamin tail domain-containing protein [Actinomycetota bacterium]|nr:lamin tail domain-containing protein [Actinomycetota bacterium]
MELDRRGRYEPDTAMADLLDAAQARATEAGAGMWAPDACGVASDADVFIEFIRYDADGIDNLNLNDEWVVIKNNSPGAVDLSGWTLKDESASHRFAFPVGFILAAAGSVSVHTGCGDDTAADLFWCETRSAVWNNSGDTGFLLDPSGNIIDSYRYG